MRMATSLLTVDASTIGDTPTASGLETLADAQLASLLTHLIKGASFNAEDQPRDSRELRLTITYSDGETPIVNPYRVKVFTGKTLSALRASAMVFTAANPTYFFSPLDTQVVTNTSRRSVRFYGLLLYNIDATEGAAHYAGSSAGGGGGGGAPSGPAGGDLSGTYPNPQVYEGRILASGTSVRRQLSARLTNIYDVRDYGAVGSNVAYALSAPEAAAFNTQYGAYGLSVSAGQQRDYAGIQAALYRAANTGACVFMPWGVYHMGSTKLSLKWTATPIAGQPARPLIGMLYGSGHDATQLVWSGVATDEPCIELLGESNPYAVRMHLQMFRVYQDATCHARSYCLLVGDCKELFSMYRVFLEGANGMRLKIASSVSYAQLCTHFVECKFDANYGTQWTQAGGEFYAVYPESSGAFWDDVKFDSCEFGGLVWCRAFLVSFYNCQFYSNTRRANVYDSCIYSPLGRVTVRDSYFEDYRVAILLTNGISDLRGATIDSCHFSATVNDVGAPLAKYAVQIIGFGVNKLGMFTLVDNHMNFAAYSAGVNGHHQGEVGFEGVDFRVPGTRIFLANNVNIFDPYIKVQLDVTGCYLCSFDASDDATDGIGKLTMFRARVLDSLTAKSALIPRSGVGAGAGETWGISIDDPAGTDVSLHGVSSLAYQPTGAIEWLLNNQCFEYTPPGMVKRWGVGLSASAYMELSSSQLSTGLPFAADNVKRGAGTPEAVVVGSPGDIYMNTTGGAGTTLWAKESGVATTTGWVALGSSSGSPTQAETTAWLAAVTSNGGTVSDATETIVNDFIIALKANAALWAKVNNGDARLSLVCGDQLAAALVPILAGGGAALDTGNNLVGGDYTPAVGITGNAANKTIDTISAANAGQSGANGCTLIASTVEVAHASFAMFWSDEANKEEAYCDTTAENKTLVWAGSTWTVGMQPDTRRGLWAASVVANAYQAYRNGGRRTGTDITTIGSTSAAGVYRFLGRAGGSFESAGSLGGYFVGPGLTNSEMRDFCTAMQNAITSLGRSFQKAAEKRPLRAYGDSMTFGAGSTANLNGWVKQYYTADPLRMCFNGGISGQNTAQIEARLLADAKIADDVVVIMAGTNDYQGGAGAVTAALQNIADMVAAVVAAGNARYVVCTPAGSWLDILGTGNHTLLISLCNGILSAYPSNSVDTRAILVAAVDGSPTDAADQANDVTPTSKRNVGDNPHLNDLGYGVFMTAIKAFVDARGW